MHSRLGRSVCAPAVIHDIVESATHKSLPRAQGVQKLNLHRHTANRGACGIDRAISRQRAPIVVSPIASSECVATSTNRRSLSVSFFEADASAVYCWRKLQRCTTGTAPPFAPFAAGQIAPLTPRSPCYVESNGPCITGASRRCSSSRHRTFVSRNGQCPTGPSCNREAPAYARATHLMDPTAI